MIRKLSTLKIFTLIIAIFSITACYEFRTSSTRNSNIGVPDSKSRIHAGKLLTTSGAKVYSNVDSFDSEFVFTDINVKKFTGITTTFDHGLHEHGFFHVITDQASRNLEIYRWGPSAPISVQEFNRYRYYPGPYAIGSRSFEIKEICGINAPARVSGWILPTSKDHHLLMSVRMCDVRQANYCVGALIDTSIFERSRHGNANWRVRSDQRGHHISAIKATGGYYSNECMPFDTTREHFNNNVDVSSYYTAVLDPSIRTVNLYNSEDVRQRISHFQMASGKVALDISIAGINFADTGKTSDNATVVILYRSGAERYIDHHHIVNGQLGPDPFLTERVNSTARYVHADILNARSGDGKLTLMGSQIEVRHYRR